MKILENYSKQSGVGIPEKPHKFPTTYHPFPIGKYICLSRKTDQTAKDYDHWVSVVEFITPILQQHKIAIVQIGEQGESIIPHCIPKLGLSFRESAFLIQNALLHLSADSAFCHFAGSVKTPLLALYGSTLVEAASPYWAGQFEALRGNEGLPSYLHQENKKEINNIKPEEVANKVFEMLNLGERLQIKTIYIGEQFYNHQYNYIPDSLVDFKQLADIKLICRMDLAFNEQLVFELLKYRNKPILIQTKKYLSEQFLTAGKSKISRIVQIIDENFSFEQLKTLKQSGIPYMLVWSGDKENIGDAKIKLFDFDPIYSRVPEKFDFVTRETLFRTKHTFASKGKNYPTIWHYKNQIPGDWSLMPVGDAIDSPDFWENPEIFSFFIKQTK